MTDVFYAIGDSVEPMVALLPMLGNLPNTLIVTAGLVILVACTNMLIKAKREGTE